MKYAQYWIFRAQRFIAISAFDDFLLWSRFYSLCVLRTLKDGSRLLWGEEIGKA